MPAAGFPNALGWPNAEVPEVVVLPKAEVVAAGWPNADVPVVDCPNADVDAGCPNTEEVDLG